MFSGVIDPISERKLWLFSGVIDPISERNHFCFSKLVRRSLYIVYILHCRVRAKIPCAMKIAVLVQLTVLVGFNNKIFQKNASSMLLTNTVNSLLLLQPLAFASTFSSKLDWPISCHWSLSIPLQTSENLGCVMFSGGIERDQSQEMG